MKYGYARVSSVGQDLTIQVQKLNEVGCDVIREEKVSGTSLKGRKEFETLMEFMREGDELVVTRIDRLARSIRDLQNIVYELKNKGGTFRTWGDCYGYYLLCSGKADAMFDIQLKPCDILPLLPIVTGAGCETIDFGDTPNQDMAVCVPGLGGKVANLFSKDR